MKHPKDKNTFNKELPSSPKKNQLEIPFDEKKDVPKLSEGKIVNITKISDRKRLNLINEIIRNSPSF